MNTEFIDRRFKHITIGKSTITKEQGRGLKFSNFGTFELRDKRARPGRNPRTLVNHEIQARRVVIFTPAPLMRDATKDLPETESQSR